MVPCKTAGNTCTNRLGKRSTVGRYIEGKKLRKLFFHFQFKKNLFKTSTQPKVGIMSFRCLFLESVSL